MTALAGIVVAFGALSIVWLPGLAAQIAVQLVIGSAVTIFPAVSSAFALGMAEDNQLSKQIARNEVYTHTGNVVFALIAGAVGTFIALQAILVEAAVFAGGMASSVFFIKKQRLRNEELPPVFSRALVQPTVLYVVVTLILS